MAEGALFFLQQPMAVALLVAAALLARVIRPAAAWAAVAVLLAGAVGSVVFPPARWHNAAVAVALAILGAWAMAGLRPRARALLPAMAPVGLAVGMSGGIPAATWTEIAGTLVAAGLLFGVLYVVFQYADQRLAPALRQVAPRVLGAWLAAMGLLMAALYVLAR
ncbi:hypothetical protein JI739_16170 [Ramlibacter sp. AW1]|uniref:Uncharacterized protein n=1 Tax=Ramlibacter aurantiacus TaxID=2801330 RepID=A0A936ZSS0_9BURK|nr:hypothetical protein [Ramlibacter aurantiacus]